MIRQIWRGKGRVCVVVVANAYEQDYGRSSDSLTVKSSWRYTHLTAGLNAATDKTVRHSQEQLLVSLVTSSPTSSLLLLGAWKWSKINFLVGPQEPLLATVTRPKLAWFGHVTRHDSLSKTILQGTLEGGRRRGQQRQCWMDNIKEWTSLPTPRLFVMASFRND